VKRNKEIRKKGAGQKERFGGRIEAVQLKKKEPKGTLKKK